MKKTEQHLEKNAAQAVLHMLVMSDGVSKYDKAELINLRACVRARVCASVCLCVCAHARAYATRVVQADFLNSLRHTTQRKPGLVIYTTLVCLSTTKLVVFMCVCFMLCVRAWLCAAEGRACMRAPMLRRHARQTLVFLFCST